LFTSFVILEKDFAIGILVERAGQEPNKWDWHQVSGERDSISIDLNLIGTVECGSGIVVLEVGCGVEDLVEKNNSGLVGVGDCFSPTTRECDATSSCHRLLHQLLQILQDGVSLVRSWFRHAFNIIAARLRHY
jgi:hypothetical protein